MKQKIENRKQLNDFFKKVNEEVDKYIIEHHIKPSRLSKYIISNGGIDKFVEEIGLSDIEDINKVVEQVLKSRLHMEKDGIMKFESFRINENIDTTNDVLINESILLKSIGDSTIEHEKIVADYFDTSLGHVEESNISKHLYVVDASDGKYNAYVFTDVDMDTILENIEEFVYNNIPLEVEIKLTENKSIKVPTTFTNIDSKVREVSIDLLLEDLFIGFKVERLTLSGDDYSEAIMIFKKTTS